MADDDSDRREAIRLAGTVLEVSTPPPTAWSIFVGGKLHRRTRAGWLVVDVDDHRVRIDASATQIVGAPTLETSGAWREMRDRIGLTENLAPAFIPTTVAAIEPAVGDHVEIYGEIPRR